jgi:hypothetical protein
VAVQIIIVIIFGCQRATLAVRRAHLGRRCARCLCGRTYRDSRSAVRYRVAKSVCCRLASGNVRPETPKGHLVSRAALQARDVCGTSSAWRTSAGTQISDEEAATRKPRGGHLLDTVAGRVLHGIRRFEPDMWGEFLHVNLGTLIRITAPERSVKRFLDENYKCPLLFWFRHRGDSSSATMVIGGASESSIWLRRPRSSPPASIAVSRSSSMVTRSHM